MAETDTPMPTINRDFFDQHGYVVARQVVPEDKCRAVIDLIFDFLGMDPNDPDDWYRPPLKPGGMTEIYQHQALWDCRQEPAVHAAFAELWGTERLWCSIDRVNFKPPRHAAHPEYDHHGFIHWDWDSTQRPIPFRLQGVLCLTDTGPEQGGFQCVPGIHRRLDEWAATQPPDRHPRQPDLAGLEVVPVPAEAGDLIIWHVATAHGNGHNVSDRPRLAQFISMYPARDHEEQRQKRIRDWREREPPGPPTFPGDPRRIEQTRYQTAELTELGRRLLGLEAWPD